MVDPLLPTTSLPTSLAHLGALIGDPVRAAILLHLSDGSRRPAGELARLAGASQQAASGHLAQLVEGGLLKAEPQGRHRFFSIASGDVAEAIESLGNWLDAPLRSIPHACGLRNARLCYDHLAGRLGVAVYERMSALGYFTLGREGAGLSEAGQLWAGRMALDLTKPPGSRRALVRLCLDWTERRHHLSGRLGAALAHRMLETDLLKPGAHRRSLLLTAKGAAFLKTELGLNAGAGTIDPRDQDLRP